ncbi:MAG: ribonuclease P protein component [Candidatus Paceibacterota bacterium]
MLSKKNLLKKKGDIERVFKKGRGSKEDFLLLKAVRNSLSSSRFGIVVSQKVSKKAVLRNKIRRRLKEIIGAKIGKIKGGQDCLLIALPGLENKDFWEIEEIINKLFIKGNLWVQ